MKKLLVFCLFSFTLIAGPGSGGGGHNIVQKRILLNSDILNLNQDTLQGLITELKNKNTNVLIPSSIISDMETRDLDIYLPNKTILLNNKIKDIQLINGNLIKN